MFASYFLYKSTWLSCFLKKPMLTVNLLIHYKFTEWQKSLLYFLLTSPINILHILNECCMNECIPVMSESL